MGPTPVGSTSTLSSSSLASPDNTMPFREDRVGFLGPTSYSAVFTENTALGLDAEEVEEASSKLPAVSPEKIKQGAEVLALLRDLPLYKKLSQRFYEWCDGIIVSKSVFRIWNNELWAEFGPLLVEGNPDQLLRLSELVWRNTRQPMKIHGKVTVSEWARSASGKNLRWEVIGTILSLCGLVAINLSNVDAIFEQYDRGTFAERMRKSSEQCLCFCYESEVLNDIYLCFMYEELILVECMKGEAHYAAWQRTGEVCDAIVAMGLHQYQSSPDTPFWLAELRKKIFISAYGRDKVMATFLGRPPRLSWRYCKMEMPLDLADSQLELEGPDLEQALLNLDANGWNTSSVLNRVTWLRVWFQHCRVREDILEIALGAEEDISYRAEQVRQRLQRLHASYPAFMRIPPEEIMNSVEGQLGAGYGFAKSEKSMKPVNFIFIMCIHTGIVQTEFLLLRAQVKRRQADYKDMIPIARRLFSLVLLSISSRDFFRDSQGDLVYLMAVHGLPSAGVLAIELLKQEQSHQYTPDILPRSETIQDLSVFISALSLVTPGEGNYSICSQGRRALKRVLDQILSPQPAPVPAPNDQAAFDDMNLYFPTGNDADFLQWLENVEWDKGNWIHPPATTGGSAL